MSGRRFELQRAPGAGGGEVLLPNNILVYQGSFNENVNYGPANHVGETGNPLDLVEYNGAWYLATQSWGNEVSIPYPPPDAPGPSGWTLLASAGGGGGGSVAYAALEPAVQTTSDTYAHATADVAGQIDFSTAGDALVEIAFNTEMRHDGNGGFLSIDVDDVPLRSYMAFNNNEVDDDVAVFLSSGSFQLVILAPATSGSHFGFHSITPSASKNRELLFARSVVVGAGDHTVKALFGVNSSGTVDVQNLQLLAKVTELTV